MKVELFPFQKKALAGLRMQSAKLLAVTVVLTLRK